MSACPDKIFSAPDGDDDRDDGDDDGGHEVHALMMMKTMDYTTHYSPVVMAWLLEMQAWVTVWEGTETGMPAVQCCRIKVEHAIAIAGGTLGQMPSVTESYCH